MSQGSHPRVQLLYQNKIFQHCFAKAKLLIPWFSDDCDWFEEMQTHHSPDYIFSNIPEW